MNIPTDIVHFLQQYFDKVLIISVPRFADREQRVKQHLQGLQFDFFWGVDKLDLDMDTAIRDGIYDEEKTKKLHRLEKPLNLGELACSLSHKKVYEAMIQNGWKKILILEDDVLPLYNNLSLLPQTMEELPADWELVYLGYIKHEQVTTQLKLKQFSYKILSSLGLMKWSYTMVSNLLPKRYSTHLKKAGFHDCSHAYAITLDGAKKLLKAQTPVVHRADDLLSYTVLEGDLTAFVTDPKFFDQESFHSADFISRIKEDI